MCFGWFYCFFEDRGGRIDGEREGRGDFDVMGVFFETMGGDVNGDGMWVSMICGRVWFIYIVYE